MRKLPDYPVVAFNQFASAALLPYLPNKRFYYPAIGRYGTFSRPESHWISDRESLSRTLHVFGSTRPLYVLMNHPYDALEDNGFKLLYETNEEPLCDEEYYFIYGRNVR
jgi:hypothetical protein